MLQDWSPLLDLVNNHQRFLLTCHVRPDGDALGSMLALADLLEQQGKSVRLVVASVVPPRYDFLDPAKRVKRFELPGEEYGDAEAIIILDTGTWNQLGDFATFLKATRVPRVVIDHHRTQDDLGAARLVDTSAEATGRLVFEASGALQVPLTAPAAHALFVAVAMDTGWFRHNNTTAATYTLASALTAAGARPTEAYRCLYEQSSLARLKLLGLVLNRLQTSADGTIAYTEIHRDDYDATGARPQDSEDLINYTLNIAGVEVGLLFMEQPRGGIKISLRSRDHVDVGRIAEQFGGGGHRPAAGAILDTTLADARTRVLEAVTAAREQE
jgi:phosphoesterase RecJ-like protein